ncbi:hypothetical protein FVEG_16487 [Fusarium verticillioides 7600]|uniref:Uncharacterized protein n=1 Tax=Gibberella moniliformis (strain M3125 / FGSC 7600) TaxID=334819 RepID=W7MYG5_GIBM7|nr:hypothetical protein FVEG_16487 [Fusarium verticillioides 7600]EWG49402.1 hypothetical protein FVEG_16487 [Fusarium verticillioides 7600]
MLATPRSTCTQAKGTRSWFCIRQAPANPITAFVQGFCCTVARVTANLAPSTACKIHPIPGVMRLSYQTRLNRPTYLCMYRTYLRYVLPVLVVRRVADTVIGRPALPSTDPRAVPNYPNLVSQPETANNSRSPPD